jgi:type I restriction enzyme, S subunit
MNALPAGWEIADLRDVTTDISYGFTTSSVSNGNGPMLLRITDIQNGSVDWSKVPHCVDAPRASFLLQAGDIVVARTGATTGKSFLIEGLPSPTAFASYLIRARVAAEVDPKYVWAFMQSEDYWSQIKVLSKGTAQPGANAQLLSQLQFPIAPPSEQRRIVAKIDSLCAKSKRARDHLDHIPRLVEKYKHAILAAAFSNTPRTKLSELVEHIQYGYTAKSSANASGSKYLRITDIQRGAVQWSQVPYVDISAEELDRFELEAGDLVFARSGATVGKSFLILDAPARSIFASYLIRVRCNRSRLLPTYAAFFFQSEDYWRQIAEGSTGTGQPNFNGTKLGQLQVPFGPVTQQQDVVHRIETAFAWVNRLSSETTSARNLIDHLDQVILAKAFQGELVPQDPNDEPASMLLERIRAERSAAPAKVKRGPKQIQKRNGVT